MWKEKSSTWRIDLREELECRDYGDGKKPVFEKEKEGKKNQHRN